MTQSNVYGDVVDRAYGNYGIRTARHKWRCARFTPMLIVRVAPLNSSYGYILENDRVSVTAKVSTATTTTTTRATVAFCCKWRKIWSIEPFGRKNSE